MWGHYFKIAIRNLTRDKAYTSLNIFVLVIGMASFLLIALYIKDELSFDRFHEKKDRIYRVWTELEASGRGEESASLCFPAGPALKEYFPEYVEESVRFFNLQSPFIILSRDSLRYNEPHIYFTDASVVDVFSFTFLQGTPSEALDDTTDLVLTERLAIKYFGSANAAMGQEMEAESGIPLVVSGVIEDLPSGTHMPIDAMIALPALSSLFNESLTTSNWVWNPCWTYLLFKDNLCVEDVENRLPEFIEDNYPDLISSRMKAHLMPMDKIHLNSHLQYEIQANGHVENVQLFFIVGIFILIVACINYTNLATSRATRNAKEVGISKVLGATRKELVFRFLGESILTSVMSIFVSLVLVETFLPVFNRLAGKDLVSAALFEPANILTIFATALLVGVMAGIYPAWMMSKLAPTVILRAPRRNAGGVKLRKALVLVQFCVALGLIIGTSVVNKQFDYLQSQDIGFESDHLVMVPVKWNAARAYRDMREELLESEAILDMTRMNDVIGVKHNMHEYSHSGVKDGDFMYFASLITDEHVLSTVGLEIVAGRNYGEPGDDTAAMLVNETLVKEMGWRSPEEAIGKRFSTPEGNEHIVGVVKDFHFVSLSQQIQPFALDLVSGHAEVFFTRYFCIRLNPEKAEEGIAYFSEVWEDYFPGQPLDDFLLNDAINEAYQSQNTLRYLMGIFSIVSVAIAGLGLLALSAFTAEQKTRELSIRRIIGASNRELFKVVAIDFVRMAILGIVITAPVAYAVLYLWLERFAYHVSLDWFNFVAVSLFGATLAMLAVVFQAWKASRLDPISALRYE